MIPTHLVYQAYGHEAIFQECLWSLLSLGKWVSPEEVPLVVIYTDKPEWFQSWPIPFAVDYQVLDAATIKSWRGSQDFVHRLKIEMLQDAQRRYQKPLLYLDTDTEFTQSPLPLLHRIEAGELFMHVSEGQLSRPQQPVLNKLLKFFRKTALPPELALRVTEETEMWNAGVLGFSPNNEAALARALSLTDALYPRYPKHIVEQFAFTVALNETDNVHSAAPWILHYWNFKEWRLWLSAFFQRFRNADWQTLLREKDAMPIHVPLQEKMGFYQRRSLWGKMVKDKWEARVEMGADLKTHV